MIGGMEKQMEKKGRWEEEEREIKSGDRDGERGVREGEGEGEMRGKIKRDRRWKSEKEIQRSDGWRLREKEREMTEKEESRG